SAPYQPFGSALATPAVNSPAIATPARSFTFIISLILSGCPKSRLYGVLGRPNDNVSPRFPILATNAATVAPFQHKGRGFPGVARLLVNEPTTEDSRMTIRFDGRVAIVTGAGGGLGREHALALAKRGAKVVVNDLGGARDGSGGSATAAETVVAEIEAAGGEAMANAASVTDAAAVEAMVAEVMARWGRIDILVNNAGILRDKSFAKMEL